VFSFLRALKTWHCPHLLLRAVLRPRAAATPAVQQSIDISYPPGPQQQTCRTPYRFIDPVPHTVQAAPITAKLQQIYVFVHVIPRYL